MTRKTSPAYRASKEETIPINKLHPFSNHPFHIRHDLEFSELVDSMELWEPLAGCCLSSAVLLLCWRCWMAAMGKQQLLPPLHS